MIYFDNAATTKKKPKEVIEAFEYYISEIGVSSGRGSYSIGVESSRMLFKARQTIANYFGLNESNVIFTKNSTEAINVFMQGFLNKGDHVVISPYEHNAVLRPLELLRRQGRIEYSVIERKDLICNAQEIVKKYFKKNTKLLAMTLASNLTGRIIFNKELYKEAKKMGISTFLDSSQGAGKIRVDMIKDSVDYLAFTGHKDLKALPGVGGLCSIEELSFRPLIQGGTGILGHEKINPEVYPEAYEAGTLNMPAIWAMKTAIDSGKEIFTKSVNKEKKLMDYLLNQLKSVDDIIIYDEKFERIGTVGFNVKGYSSNEIVGILDKRNICARGGIHCTILSHEALETTKCGVVRVSISDSNKKEEVDELIKVLKELGEKKCL